MTRSTTLRRSHRSLSSLSSAAGSCRDVMAAATNSAKARLKAGAIDLNEELNADLVIARHLWQDHRLLPPQSSLRERWESALVWFALYSSFIIPMRVAFGVADEPLFVVGEILVDACFLLDILLCFRTAILTRDYELVFEPSTIARRYIGSGWFLVDLAASLPLDYLAPSWAHRSVLQLNRVCRVSRMFKPVDIVAKLDRRVATSATWVRIFLDFRILFYCAHIVGCMWWGIGYFEYQCAEAALASIAAEGVLPGAAELAHLNASDAFRLLGATDERIVAAATLCGEGIPWVVRTETRALASAPVFQQYVTSLYWAIVTIVRNPWVPPDTQYEKIFTFGVIAFGTIAFALIIGNVNQMVRIYDDASAARRRRLAAIRSFMDFHSLPPSLQEKMIKYTEGDWQMTAGISAGKALAQLPAVLRSRVLMCIHRDLRLQCPLFDGLPRECVSLLFESLQPQLCLQGEPLIEPGQLLWELFLLRRGALSIRRAAGEARPRGAAGKDAQHGRGRQQQRQQQQRRARAGGGAPRDDDGDDDDHWTANAAVVAAAAAAGGAHGHGHGLGALVHHQHREKRVSRDDMDVDPLVPRRRRGAEALSAYIRVLDKPGQYVGLVHPFERPPRARFRVSAVKQCQLLRVTQSAVWRVLSHFPFEVQEHVCGALVEHYNATLATLQLPLHTPSARAGRGSAAEAGNVMGGGADEAGGGGASEGVGTFDASALGSYAVEERIELVRGGAKGGAGTAADARRASLVGAPSASKVSIPALQRQADVDGISAQIVAMQTVLEECEGRVAALRDRAASLPELCETLLRVQAQLTQRPRLPQLPPGTFDGQSSSAAAPSADSGGGGGAPPTGQSSGARRCAASRAAAPRSCARARGISQCRRPHDDGPRLRGRPRRRRAVDAPAAREHDPFNLENPLAA